METDNESQHNYGSKNNLKNKLVVLKMEDYKKDSDKLKKEIDTWEIHNDNITVRFTANNNFMIYLLYMDDYDNIKK